VLIAWALALHHAAQVKHGASETVRSAQVVSDSIELCVVKVGVRGCRHIARHEEGVCQVHSAGQGLLIVVLRQKLVERLLVKGQLNRRCWLVLDYRLCGGCWLQRWGSRRHDMLLGCMLGLDCG
jgi:hypothetical protein